MQTQTKWIAIGVGLLIVGGIAYYAISPLFRTIEVQDELPERAAQQESDTQDASGETPTAVQPEQVLTAEERFEIMGTAGHPAEGTVRVLNTADGRIIRYENFETINGPNLHMYLAKDLDAKDYIDLGPIKGTRGNINYPIPDDIDLAEYRYVMYWCVPFSVLFNYADLQG